MNRLKFILAIFIILSSVYPVYQIKSALGINIIPNYHAPDTLKYAKKAIDKIK